MDDFITLKGVSKTVRNTSVIKDLTLSISSGRIVGLLGNNGIGKTTLLRLLGNMQLPDEGEIRIENMPVSAATARKIVYLLAPDHLFEWMRVKDAIAYQQDFFPDFDTKKAYRICDEIGINPEERIDRMSKGNQERVCLILAFSRNAKLYLMDEPLGGIDPTFKRGIKRFILENLPEDATIIMSTHLLKDLEMLFDQILIMKEQTIISIDTDEIRAERGQSIDDYYEEVMSDAVNH